MYLSSAKGCRSILRPFAYTARDPAHTCLAGPVRVMLHPHFLHPHFPHCLHHTPVHTSSLPMLRGSSPHFSSRPCTAVSAMDTTSSQSEQKDIDT